MTAGAPRAPGSPDPAVVRWATSGAAALTGRPDGPPLGPPARLVPGADAVADRLRTLSGRLGRTVDVDPLVLLTERAALLDLHRGGERSCGGATHLVAAADGWLAVSLARDDDVDLLPAWLAPEAVGDDPSASIAAVAGRRRALDLAAWGGELGLPVAALGEVDAPEPVGPFGPALPLHAASIRTPAERPPTADLAGIVVVELASLWAGPLCGSLLAAAGATVVKVESVRRPDGARRGSIAFFDLLNGAKRALSLDLDRPAGRRRLHDLLATADVVIEGSRPRALRQLDVDADALLRAGPAAWVSITAHGRSTAAEHRVGFGDDAAVAGGLVAWEDGRPRFVADAIADPLTGLVAAAAALEALAAGGAWLLDVSLAGVAAHHSGPTLALDPATPIAEPRAPRRPPGPPPAPVS